MQKKNFLNNFTEHNKSFCLSLHYNEAYSYLFVNGKESHKFKAKDFEIAATPLCLGNITEEWTIGNMKKTQLNGYVYDFNVDYDAVPTVAIPLIHKYLMVKNSIV